MAILAVLFFVFLWKRRQLFKRRILLYPTFLSSFVL